MDDFSSIISQITREANPELKHNETVSQIEQAFRNNGFYTTREYPIYKIKDNSGRAGRIDLVEKIVEIEVGRKGVSGEYGDM